MSLTGLFAEILPSAMHWGKLQQLGPNSSVCGGEQDKNNNLFLNDAVSITDRLDASSSLSTLSSSFSSLP
jgi:hypothetical protein